MTDATVYAVASGKGGVGKTTTAVNLASGFADAGRSVVVVDADLGMGNLGDIVEATPAGPTLHEVLAGDATLDDALSHVTPGVDVVLGSDELELFGRADPRGIRHLLADLRDRYDIVVLDSGAGLSHDTALPLGLADEVILVSTVEQAAVKNTNKTLSLGEILEATVAGIVLTRVGGGKSEVDPTEIASRLGVDLLGSVPEDSTVRESSRAGEPLLVFDRESPAAQAYLEIAYDILEETLPMTIGGGGGEPSDAGSATSQPPAGSSTTGGGTAMQEEPGQDGGEGEETAASVNGTEAPGSEGADAETRADVETDGEEGDTASGDETGDEDAEPELRIEDETDGEEESRSILSKITGGLFG